MRSSILPAPILRHVRVVRAFIHHSRRVETWLWFPDIKKYAKKYYQDSWDGVFERFVSEGTGLEQFRTAAMNRDYCKQVEHKIRSLAAKIYMEGQGSQQTLFTLNDIYAVAWEDMWAIGDTSLLYKIHRRSITAPFPGQILPVSDLQIQSLAQEQAIKLEVDTTKYPFSTVLDHRFQSLRLGGAFELLH